MKNKYPEEAIELLDEYFPKGNKQRGQAMAILAVAFVEGSKEDKKKDE